MYIIAGLGNPTLQYAGTRHNVGFSVIDELASRYQIDVKSKKFKSECGMGLIGCNKVLLLKPQTYMNLSGEALQEAVKFFSVDIENQLLVVYDDIDLDVGKLRIRANGSAGGHNGMKNIILHLNTNNINRLRVGVGEKPAHMDLADYVLSRFKGDDKDKIDKGIKNAADAIEMFIDKGIMSTMNSFNNLTV